MLTAPRPDAIGGVDVIDRGSFDEMIEQADRLDPFYDRGLAVEPASRFVR